MVLAGIKVTDTHLVCDAMDLARSSSELYLFNHVMRSWLFSVLLSEDVKPSPDPELLAVSSVLHDLGLTDRSMALDKEPEVAMTHSGIAVDAIGVGLDRIPTDKLQAILAAFPRLALKNQFQSSLCNIVRRKPATSFDNILRDFGTRYVEGFTPPNFAAVVANSPFSE